MGKLHELLAVEPSLKGTKDRIINETLKDFTKNSHLFTGGKKVYTPSEDGGRVFDPEFTKMVTTVPDRLNYTKKAFVKHANVVVAKGMTNTKALAKLIVNGKEIAELSASALLDMESMYKLLRTVLEKTPTIDDKIEWTEDKTKKHTWKSAITKTYKTRKKSEFITVVQATKEHPAQIREVVNDIVEGTWQTTYTSGMITSAEKSVKIGMCDTVIRAIKKARQRANTVTVEKIDINGTLFDMIINAK